MLSTSGSVAGSTTTLRNPACDRKPRNGVHGPDRLKVLNPCAAFQGTVSEAPVNNPDGDASFQVKPDPGYGNMLNAHNRSEGGLHVEIVPRDQRGCTAGQPVHVPNTPGLGTCSGRGLVTPPLGAHVRIIGAWVLDRNNDWYEMHPVWSIAPAGCTVPRLTGRTPSQARAALAKRLCSVGTISRRPSRQRLKGRVIAQRPHAGSLLRKHARVNFTLGLGR